METPALYFLLAGTVIVLAVLSKAGLERIGLPDLLGYMVLGVTLRELDHFWNVVPASSMHVFTFLIDLGIIVLLFHVGLQCNARNLLSRLPGATLIALVNIVLTGGLGFFATFHMLGFSLVASLFIGVALTTTSLGVSIRVWQRFYSLHTRAGEMMLDVAEIDNLTGVVLLAVLTALVPYLQAGLGPDLVWPTVWTFGLVLLKITVLMLGSVLFGRYVERPLVRTLRTIQLRPDDLLIILGMVLVVAGTTVLLGFPVAIGGFFAGLIFSRDADSVTMGEAFDTLYDLFVPFFFVGVGFALDMLRSPPALGPALVLLVAAIVGKGLGSYVPAQATMAKRIAGPLAVSLLPRSEITLVVIQRGLDLGVLSSNAFTAVVLVVVATMIGVPLLLWILFPDEKHHGEAARDSSAENARAERGNTERTSRST